MDQGTLVEPKIEEGKQLVERLVSKGVGVTAAGWVKESEDGPWYLYVVTPLVPKEGGTLQAYRRLNAAIDEMPRLVWVDPLKIKVIASESAVGKVMREYPENYPGASLIPYRQGRLGDRLIEAAYLYPPVPASVEERE
jgi:hypothetical protein